METWLEINLRELENNYKYIKSKTNSKICSVIKADGYGMGSYDIAKKLEILGTDMFAVAFLKEGYRLRKKGIKKDILLLNFVAPDKLDFVIQNNLTLTLYSLTQVEMYIENKKIDLKKIKFHIKINTGMNRLGFDKDDFPKLIELIEKYELDIRGVYCHFADVNDEEFTKKQYKEYIDFVENLESLFDRKLIKHVCNSAGTLKYKAYHLDMVRVGMALYGLQPLNILDENIKSIFTWKSKITNIRKVEAGERLSYGHYTLNENKIIATIPVGYSHGYMRQLSNKAYVLIKDIPCRILGDICMDQMLIDISDLREVEVEEEVILLGENLKPEILGELANTIADDILCKISPRINRILIN